MMAGMALYLLLWGLLAVAVLALAVVATVWLVRSMRGHGDGSAPSAARQRLDERCAMGDLPREEYLQRRQDLTTP